LDMALKDNDKDIIDELRGCWIVEMGELNGFNKNNCNENNNHCR
jgi:predicted P-loop ATPase